jgi:hypothetical protein
MDELNLSHFEIVIHICVLLNFLYAVSDEFSEKVYPMIAEPFLDRFGSKFNKASADLAILSSGKTIEETKIFTDKFLELVKKVRTFEESVKENEDDKIGFKFRSIYLLGGLYGFLLLFHVGLIKYFSDDKAICCLIFYSDILVLIFYGFAFYFTCLKRTKKIRTAYVLMYFLLIIIIQVCSYLFHWPHIHSICTVNKCMTDKPIMTFISIGVLLLPIILHICRLFPKIFMEFINVNRQVGRFSKAVKTMKGTESSDSPHAAQEKDSIINDYLEKVKTK